MRDPNNLRLLSFRVPPHWIEILESIALESDLSMSDLMRSIVAERLDLTDQPKPSGMPRHPEEMDKVLRSIASLQERMTALEGYEDLNRRLRSKR